jgi:Protein of unknown function (DUF3631)
VTTAKPAESEPAAPSAEVVPFPDPEEEKNRRILAAAKQLAAKTPGEWKLWYKRRAGEPELLAELVEAQLEANEQKKSKELAEARLGEQRAHRLRQVERDRQREQQRLEEAAEKKAKEKAKAFADIVKLPSAQQEGKLTELAKKLDEDSASLSAEFDEYATSSSTASESEWDVEPWPEPVATVVVLEELIACIEKHIKAKPHEVLCVALWVMMSWVHEEAAHYSVYLVATSPKDDCGKTTLIVEVVGRLVPKPHVSGSDPTAASIFRTADHDKPTMLFDNVDTLFQRKPEVAELFLIGWTRGIKIPRVERIAGNWQTVWYDPFCAKACSLIGTNLPPPLLGRCLLIELWPLKSGEEVAEVNPFDQELIDAFKTFRRKLLRWSNDNASPLKNAEPLFPGGFTARPRSNAKLLLAIAELAGDACAEKARAAIDKLLREKREPSWLELLLREMWGIFIEGKRKDITSSQLVTRLTADPTSVWCEYGRGHNVTQREVAALLRKVHIRPRLVGKNRVGGYHRADFLEKQIFQHFLRRDPLILSPKPDTKKKSRSRCKKKKSSRRSRK